MPQPVTSLASSSLQLRKWLLKASLNAGLGTVARPAPRVPGEATLPAQARPGEDVRRGWLLVLTTRVPTEGSCGSLTPDPSNAAACHRDTNTVSRADRVLGRGLLGGEDVDAAHAFLSPICGGDPCPLWAAKLLQPGFRTTSVTHSLRGLGKLLHLPPSL